jgi:hypothetical protein
LSFNADNSPRQQIIHRAPRIKAHHDLGMVAAPTDVKVYTVNGAAAGSSSSIPDWLTRKRAAGKGKGKRVTREHVEGAIELIQGFEFPEASNKIKTTRDGHHAIATGTYKPQTRVWDLDELNLKFERHSDAENIDFVVSESSLPPLQSCLTQCSGKRFFQMTGQRSYTYKMTVPLSCTRKAAFTIAHAYPASVVPSHTTFLHAPPSSQLQATKSTVSTSSRAVSSIRSFYKTRRMTTSWA